MVWLRERLPPDAIICNGAGNYSGWIHRYYRFRQFGTQLGPTSGSMGYGVPAAVMAKRQHPDRIVVCFAGDGCFLMNGQEFATAVQFGIPVIVIVIDNAMYGTIRMHQEAHYPDRISGTPLKNPDFSAYATAFGGYGERVERTEEFAPAFERALASGKPAILHCLLDPAGDHHRQNTRRIQAQSIGQAFHFARLHRQPPHLDRASRAAPIRFPRPRHGASPCGRKASASRAPRPRRPSAICAG